MNPMFSKIKNSRYIKLSLIACVKLNCDFICLIILFVYISPRADDEFGEGILGNQKFKKMYYLNVSESGIDSR
jgi:hypothetical protein